MIKNYTIDRQRKRKLESKYLRSRLLFLFLLLVLIKRIKKLYSKGDTKKYYLNNLILYIERKDFEVSKVNLLQQNIGTMLTMIRDYRKDEFRAKILIL